MIKVLYQYCVEIHAFSAHKHMKQALGRQDKEIVGTEIENIRGSS
jgi:hypothetical protein